MVSCSLVGCARSRTVGRRDEFVSNELDRAEMAVWPGLERDR